MDEKYLFITSLIILTSIVIFLAATLKNRKEENEQLSILNHKLLAQNALLEADQLKFQLQPHTLNNILAHLKLFSNRLNKGLDSLSKTLEYILYKGNDHLVSVDDEIIFIKEYIKLNELFISEIDTIKEDYSKVNKNSKKYSNPCIPHLITAYFIENAFKHGFISQKESLKISVSLSDEIFKLEVINKIQHKPSKEKDGLGLNNMKKRLDLLITSKYEIKNSCNEKEYFSTLKIIF